MESVAAHALRIELLGNRKAIGDLRMASVEGSIEAGNLQQVRLSLQRSRGLGQGYWADGGARAERSARGGR